MKEPATNDEAREAEASSLPCSKCHKRYAIPDRKLCSTCREYFNRTNKERMSRFKAHGLCTMCGRERAEGRKLCVICQATGRKSSNKSKKMRREKGLCVGCGQQPALPDYLYCQGCKDRMTQERRVKRINQWPLVMLYQARGTQKRKYSHQGETDLTIEFLENMYRKQQGLCYWFKVPLLIDAPPKHPQRPTLERLDCSRGYFQDNIVLACYTANIGRRNTAPAVYQAFCDLLLGRKEAPSDTA
jgi:hypothetical protein